MSSLRYARWAAVSRKEQMRGDKFSIPNQMEETKRVGDMKGWTETAGPYVVPGQSRTKYIQLDKAAAEIEALRDMLHDARMGKFDVLVMSEFDRMRELLDQVFRTLASYKVQLYSLAQAIEPVEPKEYTIYKADSIVMNIGFAQMTSRLEISRTRRKYMESMPRRITDLGLPAANISWGYRKPALQMFDRKAIPEQDPTICIHILAIKDLFLKGQSTSELVDYLEDHQVEPPKGDVWYPQTVRDILRNPFYAGIVRFGASKVYIDPMTDERKRNRKPSPDQVQENIGKHAPLWDMATHEAILAELRRRSKNYKGRVNNEFTGLVECGICGMPMWRHGNGPRGEYRIVWRCSSTGSAAGHNSMSHVILRDKVIETLTRDLPEYLRVNSRPQVEMAGTDDVAQKAMDEFQLQLTRLEDAYLAGKWDLARFTARKDEIENKIAEVAGRVKEERKSQAARSAWINELQEMEEIHDIPTYFTTHAPAEINRTLHILVRKIVVGEKVQVLLKS